MDQLAKVKRALVNEGADGQGLISLQRVFDIIADVDAGNVCPCGQSRDHFFHTITVSECSARATDGRGCMSPFDHHAFGDPGMVRR